MEYLFNHKHMLFTCDHPVNSFCIDYSNGYPVVVTTNVTKNTSWKDIFKGNYKKANPDGTPEYLIVEGRKYTYIDRKYAEDIMGITFTSRYKRLQSYEQHETTHNLMKRIWF